MIIDISQPSNNEGEHGFRCRLKSTVPAAKFLWIIDGWGSFEIIEARFQASDTIIFVDLPLIIHFWWAIKRQIKCIYTPRPDGPEGCPMLPMNWPLMKMIWNIHYHHRPRLLKMVNSHLADKQVFHITSPRLLQEFCIKYCVS